jgi:hypothetical protein
VTASVDQNNRLKRIKANYSRVIIEKLVIDNAQKNKDGEWKVINGLLREYLINIGSQKTNLYKKILNIVGPYTYQSHHKHQQSYWRRNNEHYEHYERYEKYERYERFEKRNSSASSAFYPATATDEEKNAYYGKLIELKGKVTKSQIRSKYLDMISLYHPDKVQHLGPELRELAELKSKELNAAYDWLKSRYLI